MSGLICGVISGILLSLFIETNAIVEPIMLGTIGFVSGILEKNFSKESRLNIMIMVIVATFLYELGTYVLKILLYGTQLELLSFIKIILIELIYNAMITIIIYPLIQLFGKKVEDKLFGNKILRYF